MTTTSQLTKTPTTRAHIQTGDVIDGYEVTDIAHDDGSTRIKLQGNGWGEWLPSGWHISVYR